MDPINPKQPKNRESLRNTFTEGMRSGAVIITPTPMGADINFRTKLPDGTRIETTWTATGDDAVYLVGLNKENRG